MFNAIIQFENLVYFILVVNFFYIHCMTNVFMLITLCCDIWTYLPVHVDTEYMTMSVSTSLSLSLSRFLTRVCIYYVCARVGVDGCGAVFSGTRVFKQSSVGSGPAHVLNVNYCEI